MFFNEVCSASDYAQHRLFMTPEQRAALEAQSRPLNNTITDEKPVVAEDVVLVRQTNISTEPKVVTVNGVVVRPRDKSAVVWVNKKISEPGHWRDSGDQRIQITKFGATYTIVPGQSVSVPVAVNGSND